MNLHPDFKLILMVSGLLTTTFSCSQPDSTELNNPPQLVRLQKAPWGNVKGKSVLLYTLTNGNGLKAKITNYGAILTELHTPDRQGQMADVTLGFDRLEDYLPRHPYFGSICGRVVGRITQAKFTLEGQDYQISKNFGAHHLHGGKEGFDRKVWEVIGETISNNQASLKMTYTSLDGEEGYPGNLISWVTYTLNDDNSLKIEMEAQTDAPTIVNLAHHAYWNLAGHDAGNILGHELQLIAQQYTVPGKEGIPTGEIRTVAGTPFDFTKPKTIGADIKKIPPTDPENLGGYDLNLVIDGVTGQMKQVAWVRESDSGRTMEVHTTEPGVQLYTGNFLDGSFKGKGGKTYEKYAGFCLETQHYPDSINKEGLPEWPSTILRPGQMYHHVLAFKFGTD